MTGAIKSTFDAGFPMEIFGHADLVIVGAGFYGATIAERAAKARGLKVVIVEQRSHTGGNSFSERDPDTDIEVHRYGPHIFHTSSEKVWNYVNRFTTFTDYMHRPYSVSGGEVYPLPISLATIGQFFRRHMGPDEARALIAEQAAELAGREPANLEEKAISLIGRPLYEAFIRGYTLKQWQTDPRDLPAAIITRLPVRYTLDNRYFSDPHQGIPADGYAAIFEKMLDNDNIHVLLDADWFELRSMVPEGMPILYTGPIDRYFGYSEGRLGWRTCDFVRSIAPTGDYQGTAVMNYADEDVPHTRIVEYRHFYPERDYPTDRSVIVHEYSRSAGPGDDPYYPVNTIADKTRYLAYKERAKQEPNVCFGGRLGTYRYLDMDQAIGAALREWQRLEQSVFRPS